MMQCIDFPVYCPDTLLEVRAILAVGLNGTMTLLSVNKDNPLLCKDASLGSEDFEKHFIIESQSKPIMPGLYEFKGLTVCEILMNEAPRIVHRGCCTRLQSNWQ